MSTLEPLLVAVCAALAAAFLAYALLRYAGMWRGHPVARPPRIEARGRRHTSILEHGATRVDPWIPVRVGHDLQRRIIMAGGLDGLTPARLVLHALLAALVGLAAGILVVVASGWPPWTVLLATVGGALLPFVWLRDQIRARHAAILQALPFHLDLLTLCVEAGLDFGAGVAKMVERGHEGPLRDEFSVLLGQIRMGKTRAEAMQAMAERVCMPALANFLAALIQADRMGTGLGKILRLQSEQLRVERFQRAETAASEAPVKMLIPLVLFIFPTIWIILAAPLVFEWVFKGTP